MLSQNMLPQMTFHIMSMIISTINIEYWAYWYQLNNLLIRFETTLMPSQSIKCHKCHIKNIMSMIVLTLNVKYIIQM
jgi:endonuclease III